MSDDLILSLVTNAPSTAVLIIFLYLSFRQRDKTMTMMSEMVKSFMDTISKCCDDDDES